MSLNKLFEIENFFDQNNEKQLKACCGEIDSSDSLNDFFCFIKNGEYTKAVEIGEQLFNRIDEPNLKA
ncbi:MAG: hypothetical protein ACXVB1_18945, partial [Pseudobdellovibrionaceae bacterium]